MRWRPILIALGVVLFLLLVAPLACHAGLFSATAMLRRLYPPDPGYGRVSVIAPYDLSHEDTESPEEYLLLRGPNEIVADPWRIGWNPRYIVYAQNTVKWFVIDARARRQRGPYKKDEIDALPELKGVEILRPAEAYDRLRRVQPHRP